MHAVSLFRLYLLRAAYLLIIVGMGTQIWPLLLDPPAGVEHFRSVTWSLIGAVSLLCLVGLRHPLQMLPLLLFELAWKAIWLLAIGVPRRMAGPLDGEFAETWTACLFGVIVCLLVIPWGYVFARYVRQAGDRWTNRGPSRPVQSASVAAASEMMG